MIVAGILVFLISLLFAWSSWGFLRRNNEIKRLMSSNTGISIKLDKKIFGSPGTFFLFSVIGILLGVLLIIAGQ